MNPGLPYFVRPYSRPASRDAINIVEAEGCYVVDDRGKRYFDALASLWYCNVGHGRAEIVEAISRQMGRLDVFNTFDLFTNEPAEQLSAKLAELSPIEATRVFLTSSGSEAVDSAIKLVRQAHVRAGAPERTVIVSREPSYHGVTYGGMSLTGMEPVRAGFGPGLHDVVRVPHDDLSAVERAFEREGDRIAAVIAEPVIAGGGVHPPVAGYLEGLRRLCDDHGAFLIADEVVCGFGRLGAWFGTTRYGIQPDVITFAKAVTSGYLPLGGVLIGSAVRAPLEADEDFLLSHGHTYSGHPAPCAAGLAALDITEREDLPARALEVGAWIESALGELVAEGVLEGFRGAGAMYGALLPEGMSGFRVHRALVERGVIVRVIKDSIVALCPPLVATEENIEACAAALREAVGAVRDTTGSPVAGPVAK